MKNSSSSTRPSYIHQKGGLSTRGLVQFALCAMILSALLYVSIYKSDPPIIEHETEYDDLKHKTSQKINHGITLDPSQREALIETFQNDQDGIINAIEAARKSAGAVESDDLNFLLEVAMSPQLLKKSKI